MQYFIYFAQRLCGVRSIYIPILQTRKLRLSDLLSYCSISSEEKTTSTES